MIIRKCDQCGKEIIFENGSYEPGQGPKESDYVVCEDEECFDAANSRDFLRSES